MSFSASRLGRALLAVVFLACSASPMSAEAQPKSAIDEARGLAREGWKALDEENYQVALDRVTRAEALYHAPTHLLLLGNALVGLGRLADALATFERLAAEPLPVVAPVPFKDAQQTGRKRMKELLSRVPSVLVVIESADAPAAIVKVDDRKVDFTSGVAVRMDPGDHVITVEAEGFVPVKRPITLPEKGGVVRVPIALQKVGATASASAPASASATASAAPSVTAAPPSRLPAVAAFSLAGLGLLAGAITGGASMGQASDLRGRCPGNLCPPDQKGQLDRAYTLAHASTVSFAVGGAAAAVGVVLMVVSSRPGAATPATGRAAAVEPWISLGGGGLRGRF